MLARPEGLEVVDAETLDQEINEQSRPQGDEGLAWVCDIHRETWQIPLVEHSDEPAFLQVF